MFKKWLTWFIGLSCVISLLTYLIGVKDYSLSYRVDIAFKNLTSYDFLFNTKELIKTFSSLTSCYSSLNFTNNIQITIEIVLNVLKLPIVLTSDILNIFVMIFKFIYDILGLSY